MRMKKGFTLVEVSILFVIFLIVAFLVAPLSLDDTLQAKNTSRWRSVQSDFMNIFYSINTEGELSNSDFKSSFKIVFLNGTYPNITYRFKDFKLTQMNSVLSVKMFDKPQNGMQGLLMYDVNGSAGPNIWGKDVFGFNIYADRFEPFCKEQALSIQKQDCSKNGTGLCCSNYYLIGGSFD